MCLQISSHGVRRHRGIGSHQIDAPGLKAWCPLLGFEIKRYRCNLDRTLVNVDAVEIALQDAAADLGGVCDAPFFLIHVPQQVKGVDQEMTTATGRIEKGEITQQSWFPRAPLGVTDKVQPLL